MNILDCSMRDGGYVNNWYFSKEQAKECYKAVTECGIGSVSYTHLTLPTILLV